MTDPLLQRTLDFFLLNTPSLKTIVLWGPVSFAWALLCLHIAAYCWRSLGMSTGYTRKIFHVLIFVSAALAQGFAGTPMLCLFGGMTSLVVFYAILRGDGNPLYEALARKRDLPHRTHFIIVPYFSTLIGGLVANILFGPIAVVGYLVAGLGDAVGEPVGLRFGRHAYRVLSGRGVPATRTLEGSTAVFVTCTVAAAVAMALCPGLSPSPWGGIILLGFACALLEAASPHGLDNATMQIVPTWIAAQWFHV